ncbi:MAG: rhomboid family intramembrane serine protease [Pseudomonadota bacterium]
MNETPSDQPTTSRHEPVFNAPGVVMALIGALVAVHVVMEWVTETDPLWLYALAFIPARYGALAAELPGGAWAAWVTPVSHMFLHGGWLHLAMNGAWLLAFGAIVARRMSAVRFLAFFVVGGLAGAAFFQAVNWGELKPVVGASGAVSALMGAVFRFLMNARAMRSVGRLGATANIPRMSLLTALTNRNVLIAIGLWVGLNALFATDVGQMIAEGEIAWEAHLGGFIAGFLLLGLFDEVPMAQPVSRAASTEPRIWGVDDDRVEGQDADVGSSADAYPDRRGTRLH